ncbi:MAG: PEP-CTERM sorting domain-containing protein [Nitrospirota bacterium]|jgi:hypothetical protein
MIRHRPRTGTLVAVLAALLWGPAAHAVSTLDQAFEGPFDIFAPNGALYRAQTFTVGLSGLLTRFEVPMRGSPGGGTSDFEIWSTSGGVPEAIPGTTLAAGTVSFGDGQAWVGADISASGLNVTAGDVLALVQIGGSSTGSGDWAGTEGGGYTGGVGFSTFFTDPSGAWHDELAQPGGVDDLGFRTFVDPDAVAAIPEPATVVLMGLGLVGLGVAGRRRLVS